VLKTLEGRELIKSIRNVNQKSKKLYMLFELGTVLCVFAHVFDDVVVVLRAGARRDGRAVVH
jgi:hypothetical protein